MKRATLALCGLLVAALLTGAYLHIPVEEDLRFPSSGINPPGAASDPTRSATTGLLEFTAGADRVIAGNFQMPHSWKAGSRIVPHIHVLCTTASTNVSKWLLEYSISNISGDLSAGDYGTYTAAAVVTLTNPNNVRRHTLLSLGEITMTGYTESSVVMWRLTRQNTGNTDAGAVVLLDFDVHFYVEKFGKNI